MNFFFQLLNIQLPGQYHMQDISQAQEHRVDIGQQGSMLAAYFQHNKALKQMKNNQKFLYYRRMPENFILNGKTSTQEPKIHRLRFNGQIHNINFVAKP